jgi:FO synthase
MDVSETAIRYRGDIALEPGIDGSGLSREDALRLFEEGPLAPLLETAPAVRDRLKGHSVSYSKKVFIPLTDLCRDILCKVFEQPDAEERLPLERTPIFDPAREPRTESHDGLLIAQWPS